MDIIANLNNSKKEIVKKPQYGHAWKNLSRRIERLEKRGRITSHPNMHAFGMLQRRVKDLEIAIKGIRDAISGIWTSFLETGKPNISKMKESTLRVALVRNRGNKAAAARELGICHKTLYRWIKNMRMNNVA